MGKDNHKKIEKHKQNQKSKKEDFLFEIIMFILYSMLGILFFTVLIEIVFIIIYNFFSDDFVNFFSKTLYDYKNITQLTVSYLGIKSFYDMLKSYKEFRNKKYIFIKPHFAIVRLTKKLCTFQGIDLVSNYFKFIIFCSACFFTFLYPINGDVEYIKENIFNISLLLSFILSLISVVVFLITHRSDFEFWFS